MNDISIGAVGAAIIAGLISLLGLVIGKEQKVSEFRQNWIDELRKCLVAYLVNINAISDAIRVAKSHGERPVGLEQNYKLLNEANHGIRLRVNDSEEPSIALLNAMGKFEEIASMDSALTPDKIREAENNFLSASKNLLKFEWNRVKRGEKTFFITKYAVMALIVVFTIIFCIISIFKESVQTKPEIANVTVYASPEAPCNVQKMQSLSKKPSELTAVSRTKSVHMNTRSSTVTETSQHCSPNASQQPVGSSPSKIVD